MYGFFCSIAALKIYFLLIPWFILPPFFQTKWKWTRCDTQKKFISQQKQGQIYTLSTFPSALFHENHTYGGKRDLVSWIISKKNPTKQKLFVNFLIPSFDGSNLPNDTTVRVGSLIVLVYLMKIFPSHPGMSFVSRIHMICWLLIWKKNDCLKDHCFSVGT